jgi:HlyD family secretion protein
LKKVTPKTDRKLECVLLKLVIKAKLESCGIQDDLNRVTWLKSGDVVITGPYVTVSKDLNSGDKLNYMKS